MEIRNKANIDSCQLIARNRFGKYSELLFEFNFLWEPENFEFELLLHEN